MKTFVMNIRLSQNENLYLLFFMFLFCNTSICYSQWSYFTSFPSGFKDAIFISKDTGMYSTQSYEGSGDPKWPGKALVKVGYTDNGAQSWNTNTVSSDANPGGVGSERFYTVKKQHTFVHFTRWHQYLEINTTSNGGTTWKRTNLGFSIFNDFSVVDTSLWYLLRVDGSSKKYFINRYKNGVMTFSLDSFITEKPNGIFFPVADTGYVSAHTSSNPKNHLILKSVSGGTNWITVFNDSLISINKMYFVTEKLGYAVADSGKILKTSDGGTNWQYLSSNTTVKLNSVYFVNDSVGFAAGDSGIIIRTINGGQSWKKDNTGITSPFTKIFFVSDSIGFALSGKELYIVNVNWITSVKETLYQNNLLVYPNPSIGTSTIIVPDELLAEKSLTLRIYDITGKCIRQTLFKEVQQKKIEIDLQELTKSIYQIALSGKKNSYTGKIIIE